MQKGKSAAMQRGAAQREPGDRISREDYITHTSISLSKAEIGHFTFGQISLEALVASLRPRVLIMARNGFRKPRDASRLLNLAGIHTACGERWTPRLAAFLLKFMYEPQSLEQTSAGLTGARLKAASGETANTAAKPRKSRPPSMRLGGLSKKEAEAALPRTKPDRSTKRL